MLPNPLRIKLDAKKPVFGMWSLVPSAMVAESLGYGGLDFIIHDMEHGNFDAVSLDACIRATETAGSSPLVRIPGLNASAVQWALDSGAHGIIVPQVDGVEEARKAVAISKFPPLGTRGYNPFVRANEYAGTQLVERSKLHNAFPVSAIIVETKRSLDELEKICALDGLDVIYIGVYDLSVVLGLNGDVAHPDIQAIVKQSVAAITRAGKTAGLMVRDAQDMKQALALGANFLLGGVDTQMVRASSSALVNSFRSLAK